MIPCQTLKDKLFSSTGEKPQENASKPPPSSESNPEPPTSEGESRLKDPPPPTVSMSKTAKCRFTEVARCMLEIIEDLQLKKLHPDSGKDLQQPPATEPQQPGDDKVPSGELAGDTSASIRSETYASAAEYHVYEEIDYDFLAVHLLPEIVKEVPPPLPARPVGMGAKGVPPRKRAPSPPPRKALLCPQKRNLTATEVRNRPKQRGNLYCLFSDRVERRNISRSLEREWRDNPDNQEDDYGFKKSI